jgi:hypothetical protein
MWDAVGKYSSGLAKYKAQIAKAGEPESVTALIPADSDPEVPDHAAKARKKSSAVQLPDGTKTSILDITEKLKNSLP